MASADTEYYVVVLGLLLLWFTGGEVEPQQSIYWKESFVEGSGLKTRGRPSRRRTRISLQFYPLYNFPIQSGRVPKDMVGVSHF